MIISPTTRHRTVLHALWLLLLAGLAAQPVRAQDDWPTWGRDSGNQRHSPLTQIDTSNVSTLVPRVAVRDDGAGRAVAAGAVDPRSWSTASCIVVSVLPRGGTGARER